MALQWLGKARVWTNPLGEERQGQETSYGGTRAGLEPLPLRPDRETGPVTVLGPEYALPGWKGRTRIGVEVSFPASIELFGVHLF